MIHGHPEKENNSYREQLRLLQIELVKLQRETIRNRDRILVILEGRDGAGKDGTIKRIVAHLSPRETRVVALPKPSDREQGEWYFQRHVEHLPAASEFVLFNRSWYNRAGVEKVMGFCTPREVEEFFLQVNDLESMLIGSGIHLRKFYLDISRPEQKSRLDARQTDPLKQWKVSPIDQKALHHWKDYSEARDTMFMRTHTATCPWTILQADDKKVARLEIIRDILSRLEYQDKDVSLVTPDRNAVFDFNPVFLGNGRIAP